MRFTFMKKIIETVFSYIPKIKKLSVIQRRMKVLSTTGPFMITNLYESYSMKEQIFLIPAKHVSPYDMHELALIRQGYESAEFDMRLIDAYSVHYFWGSWW